MKKITAILLVMLIVFATIVSCSEVQPKTDPEPTPKPETKSEGFTVLFYMDISNLDAMADLNELIGFNSKANSGFEVYFITGGGGYNTYGVYNAKKDAKNDPFEQVNNNYKYPALANALIAAGFKDDGTNPFQESFEENTYQYWTFKANKEGKGVFSVWEPESKLMSDGDNLTDFINKVYAQTSNNDTKYVLMMWNHGGGPVFGLAGDYTVKKRSMMSIKDFSNAIKESNLIKAGKKFEAIIFDMCLMQTIEDLFAIKDYAKCMVGSENYSWASGYGQFFNFMNVRPKADYKALAKEFINSADFRHKVEENEIYTWSAIDLEDDAKIKTLKDSYINYMKDLTGDAVKNFETVKAAAKNSAYYGLKNAEKPTRVDNYDILGVAKRFYDAQDIAGGSEKYRVLKEAIDSVVIKCVSGKNTSVGEDGKQPGTTGLAFFFDPELGKYTESYYGAAYYNYLTRVEEYFSKDVSGFYKTLAEKTTN